jgi:hypothetical protein
VPCPGHHSYVNLVPAKKSYVNLVTFLMIISENVSKLCSCKTEIVRTCAYLIRMDARFSIHDAHNIIFLFIIT